MTNTARQAITVAPLLASNSDKQSFTSGWLDRSNGVELSSPGGTLSGSQGGVDLVITGSCEPQRSSNSDFPPDLVIKTDASCLGWGARCQDQQMGRVFGH